MFAGPSLTASWIEHHGGGALWHGPAARDDLARLGTTSGDVVALIDGIMISGYSPSPRECASVMERGTELWGCSSLGALRAVELAPLGMRGYGWVWESVRDRRVTWDDELVACLNPDLGARTVFLVNIRYGLGLVLGHAEERVDRLVGQLRDLPVAERTVEAVRGVLVRELSDDQVDRVMAADIKRVDAAGLVMELAGKTCAEP